MVVDDVEDDADPGRVRGIDEPAEIVGLAVEMRGRIEIDAVVAPAEASLELGDGHHLEERDADARELGQLLARPRPTCRRE